MDLVQKSLVGQNVTIDPSMYKCMEKVFMYDANLGFFNRLTYQEVAQ